MQKIKSEADLYYYNKYLNMEPGINLPSLERFGKSSRGQNPAGGGRGGGGRGLKPPG